MRRNLTLLVTAVQVLNPWVSEVDVLWRTRRSTSPEQQVQQPRMSDDASRKRTRAVRANVSFQSKTLPIDWPSDSYHSLEHALCRVAERRNVQLPPWGSYHLQCGDQVISEGNWKQVASGWLGEAPNMVIISLDAAAHQRNPSPVISQEPPVSKAQPFTKNERASLLQLRKDHMQDAIGIRFHQYEISILERTMASGVSILEEATNAVQATDTEVVEGEQDTVEITGQLFVCWESPQAMHEQRTLSGLRGSLVRPPASCADLGPAPIVLGMCSQPKEHPVFPHFELEPLHSQSVSKLTELHARMMSERSTIFVPGMHAFDAPKLSPACDRFGSSLSHCLHVSCCRIWYRRRRIAPSGSKPP